MSLNNSSIPAPKLTPIHTCSGMIASGPDHVYCVGCGAVAYYGDDTSCGDYDDAVVRIADLGENQSNL